jgi:hypothetical protein
MSFQLHIGTHKDGVCQYKDIIAGFSSLALAKSKALSLLEERREHCWFCYAKQEGREQTFELIPGVPVSMSDEQPVSSTFDPFNL